MDPNREKLLQEIMAVSFSAFDLHLYLNTHPYDMQAIYYFNNLVQQSKVLTAEFEKIYGPLNVSSSNGYPWQWIQSPWPWEA